MNAPEPIADDAVALSKALYLVFGAQGLVGAMYDEAVQVILLLAKDGWLLEPFDQDDE